VFARELETTSWSPQMFWASAEIRIAAGDTPGAVELLRRLVVVVGNPFENLDRRLRCSKRRAIMAGHRVLEQLVKSVQVLERIAYHHDQPPQ